MEVTLNQALRKGIEAQKAGQVQEADRYYTAILKVQPKHPDANHNMGILAVDFGKVQEALPFFITALEDNPSVAQYWLSYIDALIKLNRTDDAQAVLDKARTTGVKGDEFEKIGASLRSLNSKDLTFYQSVIRSLKEQINTFFTELRPEVLNSAATGWFYNLRFDQDFLGNNEEINLQTKIDSTKNTTFKRSQSQQLSFDPNIVISKLNGIKDLREKFHILDCLNSAENKPLFSDSFSDFAGLDFHEIQTSVFKKNQLNVIIIGAGPCGLYLSNALKFELKDKINILVLDNHCDEKHFKKPFSRRWLSHLSIKDFDQYFDTDIGKLAGSFGTDGYIGLPISLIEILLLISAKRHGVNFYFDQKFDYSGFNNSLVNLVFDASGGRFQNAKHKTQLDQELEIQIPNFNMNFSFAGVKNLPLKNGNSNGQFAISLRADGYYHYPHFNGSRIVLRMMKLTQVPISLHQSLMKFAQSLNNNRFYIWEGKLANNFNELLVMINLSRAEYDYLKPIISDTEKLSIDIVEKNLENKILGSDLVDFFKVCVANHDGQICLNSPFVSKPSVNLKPLDQRVNGIEVYPVGDSLFQGNPKVGNGLGSHLKHISKLVGVIACHQT